MEILNIRMSNDEYCGFLTTLQTVFSETEWNTQSEEYKKEFIIGYLDGVRNPKHK